MDKKEIQNIKRSVRKNIKKVRRMSGYFSPDYPLGGSVEWYDIEREKEMVEELENNKKQ
ncbi:hypothetical protein KKH23_07655 [Patescibacteria group bacterium]|nr:hypothetical protein [Patescibacteria group bacterium]